MRATKVLPREEWVPYDKRRQMTGWRKARSALLLVGSRPGWAVNDHRASHSASKLRQVSTVLADWQAAPVSSQCWHWAWIAGSSASKAERGNSPTRTLAHRAS